VADRDLGETIVIRMVVTARSLRDQA